MVAIKSDDELDPAKLRGGGEELPRAGRGSRPADATGGRQGFASGPRVEARRSRSDPSVARRRRGESEEGAPSPGAEEEARATRDPRTAHVRCGSFGSWTNQSPSTPGSGGYLRIETDANSNYHDSSDPHRSPVQRDCPPGIGSVEPGVYRPPRRTDADCRRSRAGATIWTEGKVRARVHASRLAYPLGRADDLDRSRARGRAGAIRKSALPPFKVIGIDQAHPRWDDPLAWPHEATSIASSAQMEKGILFVYYSTEFPKFAGPLRAFEKNDVNLARSFKTRYETWLAVHSLLLYQDQQAAKVTPPAEGTPPEEDPEAEVERERQERVRIATLSSLFAAREVKLGGEPEEPAGDA